MSLPRARGLVIKNINKPYIVRDAVYKPYRFINWRLIIFLVSNHPPITFSLTIKKRI